MKQSLIIVAVAALTLGQSAKASIAEGPYVNPSNGHQYVLLSANTWTASQAEAITLGGNLVTINDQVEQDWVFSTFQRGLGGEKGLWLGLHRETVGGPFSWISGEQSGYTNWAPGEPNFADERFVYMLPLMSANPIPGRWNNDYDRVTTTYTGQTFSLTGFYLHGVVEIVPSPSTAALLGLGTLSLGKRRRR